MPSALTASHHLQSKPSIVPVGKRSAQARTEECSSASCFRTLRGRAPTSSTTDWHWDRQERPAPHLYTVPAEPVRPRASCRADPGTVQRQESHGNPCRAGRSPCYGKPARRSPRTPQVRHHPRLTRPLRPAHRHNSKAQRRPISTVVRAISDASWWAAIYFGITLLETSRSATHETTRQVRRPHGRLGQHRPRTGASAGATRRSACPRGSATPSAGIGCG